MTLLFLTTISIKIQEKFQVHFQKSCDIIYDTPQMTSSLISNAISTLPRSIEKLSLLIQEKDCLHKH